MSGFTTTYLRHNTITEQHGGLQDSLSTPPPQFSTDLRAAPTLTGLANPPLEGVRLARLSSVQRVKRSVCPKEPVHTSISDLLDSTANVKPHYPPAPEWIPRTNVQKWSQSLVPREHGGVPLYGTVISNLLTPVFKKKLRLEKNIYIYIYVLSSYFIFSRCEDKRSI